MQVLSQVLLRKQNFNILYWVKYSLKTLAKKIKKEGLVKKLKNIEGKNEEQLKAIEDQRKKQLEEIKSINIGSKPLKTITFLVQ